MTRRVSKRGSGITQSEVQHFEWPLSEEERRDLDSILDKQTVDGKIRMIEEECLNALTAAGLPLPSPIFSPTPELDHRGYSPDSSEGAAARMLDKIRHIRECRKRGDADGAAMGIGFLMAQWERARIGREHGAIWQRGLDDKHATVRGGEATRKRPDEVRVARWQHYYAATGMKTEADRLAAEELGDGESTVRKARLKWEKAAAASD